MNELSHAKEKDTFYFFFNEFLITKGIFQQI